MRRIVQTKRVLGLTRPLVNWQFLVFRYNEDQVPRARQLASEVGVDALTLRPPFLDTGRPPLSEADAALIETWEPPGAEFNSKDESGDQYVESQVHVAEHPRCGWHYMSTAINWDGSVAPCCTVFEKKDDFGKLEREGGGGYMDVVNNERFRAIRNRFAGRSDQETGLVCEQCPTPAIMSYHHHLNRQVVLYAGVRFLERLRRLSGGGGSQGVPSEKRPGSRAPAELEA